MARRFWYFIGLYLALSLVARPVGAQPVAPIALDYRADYDAIAAFERIGAAPVGWDYNDPLPHVPIYPGEIQRGMPGFYFRFANNRFASAKLPQVPFPFAICLRVSAKTLRAGTKELAGLKNLAGLSLEGGITDAELKDLLDALPQKITHLGLYETKVTETGIKDLSTRKTIVSISFKRGDFSDGLLHVLIAHDMLHRWSGAMGKDGKRPANAGEIAWLDFNNTRVTTSGLKRLPPLKNLSAITLSREVGCDSEGLKDLACLQTITWLDAGSMEFCDNCDRSLKAIAGLTELTTLNLSGAWATDEGLVHLRKMQKLTRVGLARTGISDRGLRELSGLKRLGALDVRYSDVSSVGLEHLRDCADLAELKLDDTKVTNAGLKQLASFKKLAKLDLGQRTGEALRELPALDNLTELKISFENTKGVSVACLKELVRHRKLAVLDLTDTELTVEEIRELAQLKELVELRVTPLRDRHLRELRRLQKLHVLSEAKTITGGRPKSADEIAVLDFHLAWEVSDDGLEALSGLKNVIHLQLPHWVNGRPNISDNGLQHLVGMSRLCSLDLSKTKVTDAGLKHLFGMKDLRRLALASTAVTKIGEADLADALPHCTVVRPAHYLMPPTFLRQN